MIRPDAGEFAIVDPHDLPGALLGEHAFQRGEALVETIFVQRHKRFRDCDEFAKGETVSGTKLFIERRGEVACDSLHVRGISPVADDLRVHSQSLLQSANCLLLPVLRVLKILVAALMKSFGDGLDVVDRFLRGGWDRQLVPPVGWRHAQNKCLHELNMVLTNPSEHSLCRRSVAADRGVRPPGCQDGERGEWVHLAETSVEALDQRRKVVGTPPSEVLERLDQGIRIEAGEGMKREPWWTGPHVLFGA